MPIYEYQCEACGAHHETIQKMSDAPLKKCPACGKPRLKRLISAPVFRLKGGGWYETDFKSDAESKRNLHAEEKGEKAEKAEKADSPDTAATAKDADGSAKAETKPDAAPKSDSTANGSGKADRKPASKPAKPAKPAARRAVRRPRSGPRRGR